MKFFASILLLLGLVAPIRAQQYQYGPITKFSPVSDFNFGLVSGLFIELQGNSSTNWTGSTSHGSNSRWIDMSGAGNDFTNSGIANSAGPIYSQNGPNGYYAADFVGNSTASGFKYSLQTLIDIETNQPFTLFVLATDVGVDPGATILDCQSGSRISLSIDTNSANSDIFAGWNARPFKMNNDSNWTIFSWVVNGINSAICTNDGVSLLATNCGAAALGQVLLGIDQGVSTPYKGKIALVLGYSHALNSNEWGYVMGGINTKFALNKTITTNGFDAGSIWAQRVVNQGGSYPSANSKVTLKTFVEGVQSDGILNGQWGFYSLIATDSVIASTTVILGGPGVNDSWVNHSFVSGDLSVNGLKGNTSSKYFDTSFSASTFGMTLSSNALALYLYSTNGGNAGQLDLGCQNNVSGNDFALYPSVGNKTDFDSANFTSGSGRLQVTTSGNGFYIGSRTTATSQKIYFGNSGSTFNQIATSSSSGGSGLPSENLYVFNDDLQGSPLGGGYSDDTLSAVGCMFGVSSNQSFNIYNRTQTARQSFGGGFR